MKLVQIGLSDSQDQATNRNDDFPSMRNLLPKTKVSRAILHDNTSQERLLQSRKLVLERRSNYHRLLADRTKKNFVVTQTRKRGIWKREDDVRINCLNLPMIATIWRNNRPPSMTIVYNSPNYHANDDRQDIYVPLKPVMGVNREKTEIVCHRSKMAVYRSQVVTRINQAVLDKYNRYRGAKFLTPGFMDSDSRFLRCERLLSELRVVSPDIPAIPPNDDTGNTIPSKYCKGKPKGFLLTSSHKEKTTLPLLMMGTSPYLSRRVSPTNLTKA